MKTMTCKQLGGPCDLPLQGESANDVIKAQDAHLKDVVAGGDATHGAAFGPCRAVKNPIAGMGWYRKAKRDFAAPPEV